MARPAPTIVIGGGFAGLAAATALASLGREVLVLEAAKAAGGRARSFHDKITGREIDNGQHLLMGCYRETRRFLRRIDTPSAELVFQPRLALTMLAPGGKRIELDCPPLPAPLHLGAGLLRMKGLGLLHRAAALRAGLVMRGEVERPDDNETCDAWLRRMGQTSAIRAAFWEPLIWAVLNDDPLVASAAMLVAVLERAFMAEREDSCLGFPRVPISQLYVPRAQTYLDAHGGALRCAAPVRALELDGDGRVCGLRLKSGEQLEAAHVISAVGPHTLLELLPEAARAQLVFRDLARLEPSPIVNLWALLDRPLLDRPFVGLISSPLHWLWDRDQIEARVGPRASEQPGSLLSVTISGARASAVDTPEALRELLQAELRRFFPSERRELRAFRVIKEKRATISHAAGTYQWRPPARTPLPGLWLAGDWTRTGLPATIEGAVQSGHEAASLVAEQPARSETSTAC